MVFLPPALEIQKSIKVYQFSREQLWSVKQKMWMLERQPSKVIRALLWQPGFPLGQVIQLLCVSVYLSMKYRDNKSNSSSITHKSKSKVKVRVALSCPTLYDPMDYTVHGILQARILE